MDHSEFEGRVTADMNISVKDDFGTAVNKDWLSSSSLLPNKGSVFSETIRQDEVMRETIILLKTLPGQVMKQNRYSSCIMTSSTWIPAMRWE